MVFIYIISMIALLAIVGYFYEEIRVKRIMKHFCTDEGLDFISVHIFKNHYRLTCMNQGRKETRKFRLSLIKNRIEWIK